MDEGNERLEDGVNRLKGELELLRSEFELSQSLNGILRKLISRQLNSGFLAISHHNPITQREDRQTNDFKASFFKHTAATFNSTVNCKGCKKVFKAYRWRRYLISRQIEPAYFEHCIKQCDKYKKLGKVIASSTRLLMLHFLRLNWSLL